MSISRPTVYTLAVAALLSEAVSAAPSRSADAKKLIQQSGIAGGVVVHLGCDDGQLTAELQTQPNIQVHGLDTDAAQIAAARKHLVERGVQGDVSVATLSGKTLPYIDNLVNLLIVDDASGVADDELLRIVTPLGAILRKQADGTYARTEKPWPKEIDDWTHYLYDATGNGVSHDNVGPPRHMQWVGNPKWSRHHDRMASMSAMVSQAGKLFYIMDEGSRVSILLPPQWYLICRDAFNGSILWKRKIEQWQTHLFPLKSGPTQLARRLAAVDGVVYVTLGYEAPLLALDANTGETIREFEDSANCEEVIVSDGMVFVLANRQGLELREYAPLNPVVGDQADVRERWHWDEKPRVVVGYEAKTGKKLWEKAGMVSPLTLSCDKEKVYFHDGERITAVDKQTGGFRWTTEPASRRSVVTFNFGPRLLVYEDVVLYAGGEGKMSSYDAASGKLLWTQDHPPSGYQSPQDLMVMKGLVWCAPTTSGRDSGIFTGRDLHTGEAKVEFPPDVNTYWFHHRCYIAKATDNYLIPSRTGIEFVNPDDHHWEIQHWVRGGCLYGVLPANGLVYAPPNDCSCYPEAKLYGINALAPRAPTRPVPAKVAEEGRLEKGPAYDAPLAVYDPYGDWPTYRADNDRNGYIPEEVKPDLQPAWEAKIGGRLTPPVIANGRVYVSQVDQHIIHALNARSGRPEWTYVAGARVDSPPTVVQGRVLFGCNDGYVYCLRDSDGELVWRYRVAPEDRRHMAWEQIESVWPVHGSLLVHDGSIYAVAGRSVFLDGGLRMVKLDLATGAKQAESLMDDKNPATGNNLQEITQVLQGPVGLPDILSCNGDNIFMRSQKFDLDCNRLEIGPHSGDAVIQGSVQRGPGVHLFAPNGFLDDTWYHRSYWVFGRSFSGGHSGYYQAGKFAPSGNILVSGGGYVYGYGRKPEHFRWTTVMERELYAAGTDPAGVASADEVRPAASGGAPRRAAAPSSVSSVTVAPAKPLDATNTPLTVEAWVKADEAEGVILAHGGNVNGYALSVREGKAAFHVRVTNDLTSVESSDRIVGDWHHVAGVLTQAGEVQLYLDGSLVGTGQAKSLLPSNPKQDLQIAADEGSAVGDYKAPAALTGAIDEVRIYHVALSAEAIRKQAQSGQDPTDVRPVLSLSFDFGELKDDSPTKAQAALVGASKTPGKRGDALQFAGGVTAARGGESPNAQTAGGTRGGGTEVERKWATDIPIYVRGMALANQRLCLVGPPDYINEHEAFDRLSGRDASVNENLVRQDAALDGADGSQLLVVNSDTGETETTLQVDALPVWDGLATAKGALYLSTSDGRVKAFAAK